MFTFARALQAKGTPVPEIRKKLVMNAGRNPSLASVYRVLADDQDENAAAHEGTPPPRPVRTVICRPDEPLTADETRQRDELICQRLVMNEDDLEGSHP